MGAGHDDGRIRLDVAKLRNAVESPEHWPVFRSHPRPGQRRSVSCLFFFRFLSSNDLPMWRQSQEPMMGEEGGNCWERAAISLPARQRYKRIGILEKESRGSRGIASSIGFGCEMDGIGKRESAGLAG